MDNLKNISVLSSAAYVTKLKRFSSVTFIQLHRIPKIQLVNENISRPSRVALKHFINSRNTYVTGQNNNSYTLRFPIPFECIAYVLAIQHPN